MSGVISMNRNACSKLAGALASLLASGIAWGASCSGGDALRTVHTLPATITLQRDAPIGTVLYDTNGWVGGGKSLSVSCKGPGTIWLSDGFRGGAVKTALEHVYESGVPGIGIKVAWSNNGRNPPTSMSGGRYMNDPPTEMQISSNNYLPAQLWWIQLVKTGPIESGTFQIKPARVFYHNLLSNELTFTPSQLVFNKQGCRLQTPNITVELPVANLHHFQGVGSSAWQRPFNVSLECDPDIRISYRIDGQHVADSVLRNGEGADMATGVGVQLLKGGGDGGTPLVLGAKAYHMDMGTVGGLSKILLIARYYQTEPRIVPGAVMATATLTLFYE